jgi:signal transduction histidine kinase
MSLRKSLILNLILLPGFALLGHAQKKGQAFGDSIAAELPNTTDPVKKMKQLSLLDSTYITINVNKSLEYATERLEVARSYKEKDYIARALVSLSRCYYYLGRNEELIKCCTEAVALCEGSEKLKRPKELALTDLAMGYMNLGNYAAQMQYTLQALPIAEEQKDSATIVVLYNNAGLAFLNQNDLDKAQLYEEKGLAMAEKRHDLYGQKMALENLGHIYLSKNRKKEALRDWNRALQLMTDTRDSFGLATVLNMLVAFYIDNNDSSLPYALRANAIWERVAPDCINANVNLGNIGEIYESIALDSLPDSKTGRMRTPQEKQALLQKAYQDMSSALNFFRKNDVRHYELFLYKRLAVLQYHLHDYKTAFENLSASDSLSDSVYSQDSKNKLAAVDEQREIAIRDKQLTINHLELVNQKRQRWYFIAGLVVLLLIGGLLYRQSVTRKRTNTVLLQLNTELDQANEVKTQFFNILNHDLRAPVATLINLLHLQQDAPDLLEEKVRAIHAQRIFANAQNLLLTMEDLLLWSKGQMKTFQPSVRSVVVEELFADLKNYFSGVTDVRLTFDAAVSRLNTDEHYLKTIMRNLTNNAIKALTGAPDAAIHWKAWEEGGKHYLSITDNGPGVNEQQLKALYDDSVVVGGKTGLGLHVVRDLARAIGCLVSVNSLPGGGTKFILSL